jgi:hypothetical protein
MKSKMSPGAVDNVDNSDEGIPVFPQQKRCLPKSLTMLVICKGACSGAAARQTSNADSRIDRPVTRARKAKKTGQAEFQM